MKTAAAILAATLALPAAAHDAAMRAVMHCQWGKGLETSEITERNAGADKRGVLTADGEKMVSVADGVRMMLSPPGMPFFVNLKVEQSAPGKLADDQQAVLAQARYLAQRAGKAQDSLDFRDTGVRGVRVLAMDRPSLERGAIGMYTFTADHANLLVTAYLLDQGPGKRPFDDYAGYEQQRDAFIKALTACMAPKAALAAK